MLFSLLADLIVLLHFLYVLFVVLGGLLVLRYRWVALLHVPAALWGALVEITGWMCPLTPLEMRFRFLAGQAGYEDGFIEHYLLPLIYPPGLTRGMQISLGVAVALVNLAIYLAIWRRGRGASNNIHRSAVQNGLE